MSISQPACICGELLINHPGGVACETAPTGPRVCVWEEYQEIETPPYYIDNGVAIELPGPMQLLKVWTFRYSDGTTEQVISRGLKV